MHPYTVSTRVLGEQKSPFCTESLKLAHDLGRIRIELQFVSVSGGLPANLVPAASQRISRIRSPNILIYERAYI
jgi:hypothetical protein